MKNHVLFVALALVSAGALCAQNKVTGTVLDASDKSKLIGVNITLNTNSEHITGAVSDNNGRAREGREKIVRQPLARLGHHIDIHAIGSSSDSSPQSAR